MKKKTERKTGGYSWFIALSIAIFSVMPVHGQIAKDKQMHLGAGAVVGSWGYMIPAESKGWKPIVFSIGSATVAGVGKELVDMGGFGTPDIKDLGATVIGGVVTAGIITGVRAIFHKPGQNRKRPLFAAGSVRRGS